MEHKAHHLVGFTNISRKQIIASGIPIGVKIVLYIRGRIYNTDVIYKIKVFIGVVVLLV